MALQSSDLFYVQRPSGGEAGNYKMNAGELLDFVASSPAVSYRGTVDCTAAPSGQIDPDPAVVGDMYINTGTGTVAAGWTGIVGDAISDGQRVIFDGTDWAIVGQSSGGGVQVVTGTAPITVTGDADEPVIGIDEATNAAYGSTRLAQDPPNAGDLTSTAATDVLHVAHFNELASRITVGAAGGVQSVSADNGLTAAGTTDVTVSGVDATTAVKGVVQLTDTVAANSTLAVTGTAVQAYAVPLDINSLTALP